MIPPPGYLRGVREICDRYGIVFIAEALVRTILDLGPVPLWVVLGVLGAALRGASLWADHSLGTGLAAGLNVLLSDGHGGLSLRQWVGDAMLDSLVPNIAQAARHGDEQAELVDLAFGARAGVDLGQNVGDVGVEVDTAGHQVGPLGDTGQGDGQDTVAGISQ